MIRRAELTDPRVLAAVERYEAENPGHGWTFGEVRHDAWCPLLKGGKRCRCAPVVYAGPEIEARHEAALRLGVDPAALAGA